MNWLYQIIEWINNNTGVATLIATAIGVAFVIFCDYLIQRAYYKTYTKNKEREDESKED